MRCYTMESKKWMGVMTAAMAAALAGNVAAQHECKVQLGGGLIADNWPSAERTEIGPDAVSESFVISGVYNADPATGWAEGSAFADFGVLRARSEIRQIGGWNTYGGGGAWSLAQFSDLITIKPSDPSLLGKPGTFTVSIHFSGFCHADFNGLDSYWSSSNEYGVPIASGSLSIATDNNTVLASGSVSAQVSGLGPLFDSDGASTLVSCDVPFIYGTPCQIKVSLYAYAQANSDGWHDNLDSAGALSDFGHSAVWNGITAITAEGEPINLSEVSVEADSGSDYTRSYWCRADITDDGFVNGDDFDAFALLFEAGDPGADLTGDTFVNGDDYDLFAEHFEAGC